MKLALLLVLTIAAFAHPTKVTPISNGFMSQGKLVLQSSKEWVRSIYFKNK